MDHYEFQDSVGEGTYGKVFKARVKSNGRTVAIKKFKESDEDEATKKTALREIRILKQLRHDNVVSLLEVFRHSGKNYLVFEYVDRTILQELDSHNGGGLEPIHVKKIFFQLCQALKLLHENNIIHRDIKPENLLISKNSVLKLCDFGFARILSKSGPKYTDYVATRWYRSPELLVGDTTYGKGVDVWAAGCMFFEIATGNPLFPGASDLDQLMRIMNCCGPVTKEHIEIFSQNPYYKGVTFPDIEQNDSLAARCAEFKLEREFIQVLELCLVNDPQHRATVQDLLATPYFEGFAEWFAPEFKEACARDQASSFQVPQEAKTAKKSDKLERKDTISMPAIAPASDIADIVAPLEAPAVFFSPSQVRSNPDTDVDASNDAAATDVMEGTRLIALPMLAADVSHPTAAPNVKSKKDQHSQPEFNDNTSNQENFEKQLLLQKAAEKAAEHALAAQQRAQQEILLKSQEPGPMMVTGFHSKDYYPSIKKLPTHTGSNKGKGMEGSSSGLELPTLGSDKGLSGVIAALPRKRTRTRETKPSKLVSGYGAPVPAGKTSVAPPSISGVLLTCIQLQKRFLE